MPENNLYEYATRLKSFDYDKVQEAIGQNAEGNLVVDDKIRTMDLREAHLPNQRNDMASHLDTYCSYAGEMRLADDRDLSFMSKEDAARKMQSFIGMLEEGGELEVLNVVAIDQTDFENVKKTIMEDGDYQFLSVKGYGNEPNLRQTSERFLAYPAVVKVLLSNNGIEMITMMGMFEPCEEHQNETAIIGEDGIKEAIMKKFGDAILSNEFRAKNIWMEYFPLLTEDSFTEIDLIPVWCVEFEVDGQSVEDSRYSIRFNAITGDEIS